MVAEGTWLTGWKKAGVTPERKVLKETLHLVEDQFPQIETAAIHRRLINVRAAHEGNIGLV